jgi:predicted acylesterase/phospholipase RssA
MGAKGFRSGRALRAVSLIGALLLIGCSSLPRREAPPTLFNSSAPAGFSRQVRFLSSDRASVERESAAALQRIRDASQDGIVRALVLSGGGAGGAFGAGALVGLSRRHERPRYDVVTGVSAGALIAPFAFLGPSWDAQLMDAFTSRRAEQMSLRGLLALPFGASHRSAVMTALVDHYVTPELMRAVAREAAAGRLLWVATTDLDKEETVIWDMGAIAARGGEVARKLFRDVLVASASIPGVFAPVLIHVQDGDVSYDEMHVDGNASTPLFVAPVAAYFALLNRAVLEGAQVYVLINGQIIDAPQTTPYKLGPIMVRTLSVALRHMAREEVVGVNQFAEKYGMSVQSTYLPYDYPKYNSADFRASTMRPLFEYGERCAEAGRLWTTMDETMATVAAAAPASARGSPARQALECPRRDVEYTVAGTR